MIQAYPDKPYLVEQLTPVVSEEWAHFRLVLKELEKRGLKLGFQRKDEYVNKLQQFVTKGGRFEDRFLDRLLMAALIEARSCERFRLLSEGIADKELREFYRKLMVAEAHHYTMFIEIANTYIDKTKVKARWQEWLQKEASIMQAIELRGDRVH